MAPGGDKNGSQGLLVFTRLGFASSLTTGGLVVYSVLLRARRTFDKPAASSTIGPCAAGVNIWIGDRLLTGKPSRYVTGHLGQLSLPSLRGLGKSSTNLSGCG